MAPFLIRTPKRAGNANFWQTIALAPRPHRSNSHRSSLQNSRHVCHHASHVRNFRSSSFMRTTQRSDGPRFPPNASQTCKRRTLTQFSIEHCFASKTSCFHFLEKSHLAITTCSPDRSLEQDDDSLPREIAAEYSYNTAELQERLTTNERSLTQDQRHIYDELLAYVARAPDDTIVFLDAPGGTGKTYCSIFFLIKYDRKATLLSQSLLRESQQHFSSAAKQLTPSSSYLSTSVATSVPRVPFRKTQRELDFSPWPKWRLGRMHYGEQKSSRGIRQIPPRYSKQRLTHGRSASNTGRRL